jgi:hypothetical protein
VGGSRWHLGETAHWGILVQNSQFNSFVLQHFLCIRHRPALMLGLLGVLSLVQMNCSIKDLLLRGHHAVELAEGRVSQGISPSNRNGGDVLVRGSSGSLEKAVPFSGPYLSLAPTFLRPLPFSSPYLSSAPTFLQPLPFSGPYLSPAPAFLWPLPFSGPCLSLAPTFLHVSYFSTLQLSDTLSVASRSRKSCPDRTLCAF